MYEPKTILRQCQQTQLQDLEEALMIDPARADVKQQCVRAKADLAEHKRLHEMNGNGAEPATQTAKAQLDACKALEATVRALAAVSLSDTSQTAQSAGEGDGAENQIDGPAGLSALPARSLPIAGTCAKLTSLATKLQARIRGNDDHAHVLPRLRRSHSGVRPALAGRTPPCLLRNSCTVRSAAKRGVPARYECARISRLRSSESYHKW